jgi:hypothetical protein
VDSFVDRFIMSVWFPLIVGMQKPKHCRIFRNIVVETIDLPVASADTCPNDRNWRLRYSL